MRLCQCASFNSVSRSVCVCWRGGGDIKYIHVFAQLQNEGALMQTGIAERELQCSVALVHLTDSGWMQALPHMHTS